MVLVLEIGMLLLGIYALSTGKFRFGKRTVAGGTCGRLAGFVLLLPLPVSITLVSYLGATQAGLANPVQNVIVVSLIEASVAIFMLLASLVIACVGTWL